MRLDVAAATNLVSIIYLYGNNELAGLTGRRSEAARRLHRSIEKHDKDHIFEIKTAIFSVYEARKVPEEVEVAKKEKEGPDDGSSHSSVSSLSKSKSPQRKLSAGRGASQAQRDQDVDAASNHVKEGNSSSSHDWANNGHSVGGSASGFVAGIPPPVGEDGSVVVPPELNVAQPSNNCATIVESNSIDSTARHSSKGKKQRREE